MIDRIKQLIDGKNSKSFFKILSQHADILQWITTHTDCYNPQNFNERLYILLKEPPTIKDCGKYPLFNTFDKGYRKYCGSKSSCVCNQQDHSQHLTEYHQTLTESKKKQIKEKAIATNIKKYGTSNPVQSKQVQEKLKKVNLEKYGTEFPLQSKIVQDKIKNTILEKYGVEYPFQNKDIIEKSHNTLRSRYGDDFMIFARSAFLEKNNNQNPFVVHQDKVKSKLFENYGVDHPLKNQLIKEKSFTTLQNNYGVVNPSQLHIDLSTYEILENQEKFLELCKKHSLKELSKLLGVTEGVIWNRHDRYNLNIFTRRTKSQYEEEIAQWLTSNSIQFFRNFKINTKTVDFLIGSNFAIEFNGLYPHSENTTYGKNLKIDSNYHYQKYIDCKNKNIKLFTIFEDEWNNKKNIIKNKILIDLGLGTIGVPARKLTVKEIDSTTAIGFLDSYHLQGGVASSVYLGSFHNDQLISVMTFKKSKDSYEINRFASDFDIHPGLFSKMLSYFEKNYKFFSIYSFSDNRWSWGEVYKNNGFVLDSTLKPDYFVTNYRVREHKFNWRKQRIKSRFSIDISNKTELDLIRELKWDRIWDCGKIKWIK